MGLPLSINHRLCDAGIAGCSNFIASSKPRQRYERALNIIVFSGCIDLCRAIKDLPRSGTTSQDGRNAQTVEGVVRLGTTAF